VFSPSKSKIQTVQQKVSNQTYLMPWTQAEAVHCSDVNKDLTLKAKDKDKDQTLKDKDQTYKDKDQTPKDKDQTFKAKDQDKD